MREILVSGLREYLASIRVGLPVTQLAKWKTTFQMGALGFLLAGDSGAAFIGLGWLPATTIGEVLLWVAAALTPGHRVGLPHRRHPPRDRCPQPVT